jgi:hypothetical protein
MEAIRKNDKTWQPERRIELDELPRGHAKGDEPQETCPGTEASLFSAIFNPSQE